MTRAPTAKDRFTSLDTLALVRELRARPRARVDKAFDLPGGGWSLALRTPGAGRSELLLVPGLYAAHLESASERSEELSPFARELRRLLVGGALRDVAEPGGERYLELSFARSDEPDPTLVGLEMFGAGNLILARAGTILAVAKARRWAHREVRIGAAYSRPPVRLDPWKASRSELEGALDRSRTDFASTLAARLSFGGPVAEELIARLGVEGAEPASTLASAVAGRLHDAVVELIGEVGDRPVGFLYRREGVPVDATPYASRRWADAPGVEESRVATFSEAAHEYFRTLVVVPAPPEVADRDRVQHELERLRGQQTEAIANLEGSIASLQRSAEAIFAHYPEAEAELERARNQRQSEPRLRVTLGAESVELSVDRTPRESAQALYAEAKRLQAKLAGARAARADTETRLANAASRAPRPRTEAAEPRRSKPHWFERFRWFITSEGAVVVGGRDASSNDLLVRRNLKPGDRYVHADLHGAASVILKHPAPGEAAVTEASLREAGQWAVVFSKAWRAGLASAEAFWVEHDQVSKSGTSGEFVARGAWAIHGSKHVMRDLPTEVAIGTVDYAGDRLWTAAPPAALRARGVVRVVLVPGPERGREAVEVELVRSLGLPRPRLQGLLPAGGLEVRRA